jgi:YVTN family beta-propeller protein
MRTHVCRPKIYFSCFLLFLIVISCTPQPVIYKEPLKNEGEVLLYLQPMPKEAEQFSFTVEDTFLIRDDDTEVPLPLSFHSIEGRAHVGVQKLLASGRVPPGAYKGIRITISGARLEGAEGPAELLVPEDPVSVNSFFQVGRGDVLALFLGFHPLKSVTDGIRFSPLFTLQTYGNELFNLTGYITIAQSNIISVFNKKTMLMTGAIATGRSPAGMVFDQDGGKAYVVLTGDDAIEVIDIFRGKITGKIRLNSGDEPLYLCLTPDGSTLLSVNRGSNTVSIIDTKTRVEDTRLIVEEEPTSAVLDPTGLRAYIMNSMSNSISVLDISNKAVFATIAVDGMPLRGAFNRNGDALYVINRDIPDLTVIDPTTLSVSGKIFIGTGALSIKVDTRTGLIYVGNGIGSLISVVSPSSSMFIDTIMTGGTVAFMTIDDEENTLFALIPDRKLLQKVNLTNKKVVAELDVGEGAYSVAVMGER